MAKIEKFEDLQAWQKAHALVKDVYSITERPGFRRDFALRDQVRRSAISVSSNIAEGFARRTNKEFVQFLYIAHGSVAEVEAQLYAALDLGYIDQPEFDRLYALCYDMSKMTMGLIKYLRSHSSTTGPANSSTQKPPNSGTR
jgi:four helix bundle protein